MSQFVWPTPIKSVFSKTFLPDACVNHNIGVINLANKISGSNMILFYWIVDLIEPKIETPNFSYPDMLYSHLIEFMDYATVGNIHAQGQLCP